MVAPIAAFWFDDNFDDNPVLRASLSLCRLVEDRLHCIGSAPSQIRDNVCVNVHRHGNGRMTKQLHYNARMYSP